MARTTQTAVGAGRNSIRLASRSARWLVVVGLAVALGCSSDSNEGNDVIEAEEEGPFPPAGDPSAFTGPEFGELDDDLPHTNDGSFEGGLTGTPEDAARNNAVPEIAQRGDGIFNVPTNGPPSPVFGAQPFSQKMLRFEEFGLDRLVESVRSGLDSGVALQDIPDRVLDEVQAFGQGEPWSDDVTLVLVRREL